MSHVVRFSPFRHTFKNAFRSYHARSHVLQKNSTHHPFGVPAFQEHAASFPPSLARLSHRSHSTESNAHQRPLTDRDTPSAEADQASDSASADEIALRKAISPAYQLWFTCKKCLERSGHTVSKQAYHYGTCVINCPQCKSRHLISDNLKIFSDTNRTLEDIAKEFGEKLKKGRLGTDGDVEFYDEEAEKKIEDGIKSSVEHSMDRRGKSGT